ncbi:MAG TPA: hypothetical protein VNE40_03690 [Candidatus Dormibacteraeota bacterium]|nr:hypothetical protein [Candidatus Dormibacteraeota bacterium]
MADKKKSYKLIKIITLSLLGLMIIFVAIIGLNYNSYKDGNRSVLFGTLDNYTQSQTLKFGNLNLKVSSVTLKPYPKPDNIPTENCDSLKTPRSTQNYLDPYGTAYYDCENTLNDYQNAVNNYLHTNQLTIHYTYSNISNVPMNFSDYKLTMALNTDQGSNYVSCNPPSYQILKGENETDCLSTDISNTYHGPLSLIVKNGNKEKIITLSLPATKIK